MNISPNEAEEALESIQKISQKTRKSLANSGTHLFLITTGIVWMIGFVSTQFLTGSILGIIWGVSSVVGGITATLIGARRGKQVRKPGADVYAKRAAIFWMLLAIYALVVILLVQPLDPKTQTLLIVLFIMLGQLAMGILLSFSSVWWALAITVLALIGYFLLPGIFYLWMGILVGGSMIALGTFIRLKW